MNSKLAEALIDKGILKPETEIDIVYNTVDLSGIKSQPSTGTFLIKNMWKLQSGEIYFNVISTIDGSPRKTKSDDIILIDGMEPKRIAHVYNIKLDGTMQPTGKKRGRKPKVRIDEQYNRYQQKSFDEIKAAINGKRSRVGNSTG